MYVIELYVAMRVILPVHMGENALPSSSGHQMSTSLYKWCQWTYKTLTYISMYTLYGQAG